MLRTPCRFAGVPDARVPDEVVSTTFTPERISPCFLRDAKYECFGCNQGKLKDCNQNEEELYTVLTDSYMIITVRINKTLELSTRNNAMRVKLMSLGAESAFTEGFPSCDGCKPCTELEGHQ